MAPTGSNTNSSLNLLFPEDEPVPNAQSSAPRSQDTWKILVIDDDEMIHQLTDSVLEDFTFRNKGLEIIHGFSGKEACKLIQQHPDTAVVLLDVVMETENAGFDVVQYIRETLKNHTVRIILRTGQPGSATETEIISEYEINDYREKADLTSAKLHSSLIVSLRAFQDMKNIQAMANSGALDSIFKQETDRLLFNKQNISTEFHQLAINEEPNSEELANILAQINKSDAMIYIKDLAGHYMIANNAFLEFFNLNPSDIIGCTDRDLLPIGLAEQFMKSDMRVLNDAAPAQQEEQVQFNDIKHLVYAIKFPLYNQSGKLNAICGVIAEIVEAE